MNSRSKRVKANVEGDRLSSLPDDLIAKILSFIGAKQAVETSVLSSRWRDVWTKLTYLNVSSEDFSTLRRFHKFFTYLMFSCKWQVETSLNLHGKAGQVFVQKILNNACSHNIQQLSFTAKPEKNIEVPLSLFKSKSLKCLSLIGPSKDYFITPTSTWELPALARLYLDRVTLYGDNSDKCVDLFSKCKNLKNLTLINFRVLGGNSFTICHPELSTLVIKNRNWCVIVVAVIAPQLKNLTIMNCEGKHMVSAPELTTLQYTNRLFQLSVDVDSFPFIENVGLCISYPYNAGAQQVVDLLRKFNNVKILTLSLEIIELFSTSIEVIQHQPSPFVNLRSLRIFPELFNEPHKKKINMANEVRNYLLDGSPGATFTAVTREKIRAVRDAKSAQNLMAELRVVLDKEKASMKNLKEDKRPQLYTNVPLDMWQRVLNIHSFWDGLDSQIKQGKTKILPLISLMQQIKGLLLKLPTSNKAELQLRFASLCTEAETLIHKILTRMNIECHTKENGLSDCIREFVIAARSSR